MTRPLAIACGELDWRPLRAEWDWLVPAEHFPLMIGAFGDWIFQSPAGSMFCLCLLEGDYRRIAASPDEFGLLKQDRVHLNDWFKADWVEFAERQNLIPNDDECLGWKVHPIFGKELLKVDNIGVFSLRVYQAIIGQLFRQTGGMAANGGQA